VKDSRFAGKSTACKGGKEPAEVLSQETGSAKFFPRGKLLMKHVLVFSFLLLLAFATALHADESSDLTGTVTDSLGAVIPGAKVEVLDGVKVVGSVETDAVGRYHVSLLRGGRYLVRGTAAALQSSSREVFVGGGTAVANLTLFPSPVQQTVVVTATGSPLPEAQTGASISVLESDELETHRDLQQGLRLAPGIFFAQTGQAGAQTTANVRGGPDSGNKVLIDGIPANDIGGGVDFGVMQPTGLGAAELFRGPNSALFGSDALASVINLTTQRGVTPLPQLTYQVDGGTYGTYRQEATFGGAWKRFDYFSDLARFDTRNSDPYSGSHNLTYAGNFSFQLAPNASLRATVRRNVNGLQDANQLGLFGTPDDGSDRRHDTSFGVTFDANPTQRWHVLARYGAMRLNYSYANYGPTGMYYPGCFCYLGAPVTIRGANGYVVSPQAIAALPGAPDDPGQAIFQYPGNNNYQNEANRDFGYLQNDYHVSPMLNLLFGFRYERERGFVSSAYSQGQTERGNYSYMMQLQGRFWNRLYYTVGSGLENNAVFGVAGTPRASLAYYLLRPQHDKLLSGTKVKFNFGKGIKEPSIPQELNSLYRVLQQPTYPDGLQAIAQYDVKPFRAEASRTYDGGLEQSLAGGKARVSIAYFHNQFNNLAEYVPNTALTDILSPALATYINTYNPYGYVYVNTLAYKAQGLELEGAWQVLPSLRVRGGWTHVNAVVQRSFTSSALSPAVNPLFPTVQIGAYSPLVGARPFHVPPDSGFMAVDWKRSRWFASLTGSFVSRRDDSTFLSDSWYGNTMLLPNHNLDPAYQKLDLYGSYQITPRLTAYATMENLLNQRYQVVIGYPALPFTVRAGMKIRLGGESWKLK
jgi:iron complex outermembrane receptor protein/vitamin B12 transporter